MTGPRRRMLGPAALLCAAGLLAAAGAAVATEPSSAAKKRCRTVTKTVHGKKRRVRVCSGQKRSPKPGPKPKPAVTGADLVVSGAASPEDASAGAPVVYRVTVSNRGPKRARDVVLVVESPIGLDAVRPDASGVSCDPPGRGPTAFRCRIGALAVHGSWTVELEGTPPVEGLIRFAAVARSSTRDPTPRNAVTQDEVTVKPAGPPGQLEPPPPPLQPAPPQAP